MKNTILAITIGSLALLAAGCKPADDKGASTTPLPAEKAKMDAQADARDMEDYSYERKAEFTANMRARLDELDREMSQFAARVEKSDDAVKAEAKIKLDALHAQAEQIKIQLAAADKADGTTWDAVKADSKKAYGSFKDGVNQTRQWLSDKIAP